MMQGALTFQHPILNPLPFPTFAPKNHTPCPFASKPNCISYTNSASLFYKSVLAVGARAGHPSLTSKSLVIGFLSSPLEDKLKNQRDVDCRYLEEKRLEQKLGGGDGYDDYYAVPEPRFNELVRGDPQHREARVDDDPVNGDSEDVSEEVNDFANQDFKSKSGVDDVNDFGHENKPKPKPSFEELLTLVKWSHSLPHTQ
ncbi:hypothetical protein CMV_009457 [Castanea mollissima]|uniref:Uncharacterized protein n=1 Tax=Castanea mollissima TaxID=60419 RepID=A0A8J4R5M1_9ROSI|nr:hypothetical protein CMV_009457 [Castanea mollissima]